MLRGIAILDNGNKMFILKIVERFKGGIIFLAAHKVMRIVDGAEDSERVVQSTGGIGNVLSHS